MVMPLSSPASSRSEEAPSTNSGDFFGKFLEAGLRELQRARAECVAQRALVAQPLHHREPDVLERHAGKFGVQIVRRLPQILGVDLLADVDRLARDLPAVSDHDDQDFGGAQRNEFDLFENAVSAVIGSAKATRRDARESTCDTAARTSSASAGVPASRRSWASTAAPLRTERGAASS